MLVELEKKEIEFLTDMALNCLLDTCENKLKNSHLMTDKAVKNLTETRDEAKRLMKKLDPTLF